MDNDKGSDMNSAILAAEAEIKRAMRVSEETLTIFADPKHYADDPYTFDTEVNYRPAAQQ